MDKYFKYVLDLCCSLSRYEVDGVNMKYDMCCCPNDLEYRTLPGSHFTAHLCRSTISCMYLL